MNDTFGKDAKNAEVVNFRVHPRILMEGLRKTTENFSHDSRSMGRNSNVGPSKHREIVAITPKPLVQGRRKYIQFPFHRYRPQ
jgi:hypothetical protein